MSAGHEAQAVYGLLTKLRTVLAAQPAHRLDCFGLNTRKAKKQSGPTTQFLWRNYFTGERGFVGTVPADRTLETALLLLAELAEWRLQAQRQLQLQRQPNGVQQGELFEAPLRARGATA